VTNLSAEVKRARRNLFGRGGIISACQFFRQGWGEPRVFAASIIIAPEMPALLPEGLIGNFGAAGFTYEEAFLGSVGECVERYCAAVSDRPDLIVEASQNELGAGAIGMDVFNFYRPDQYDQKGWPFGRWDPGNRIRWVRGRSLVDGAERFVPASLVFVPYQPLGRADFPALSVSSGQACHPVWERAVLTGLYEVVERDAFMINWLRTIPGRPVDFLSDPVLGALHRRHFAGSNTTFRVFELTLDIPLPVMICVAESSAEGNRSLVCVGASCRTSPREAATKAIIEAAQGMIWCRDLIRRRPDWRPQPDWSNIVDFEDHVRMYCEPDVQHHLDFVRSSAVPSRALAPAPEPLSPEKDLKRAIDLVKGAGLEPIVLDLTTPDVRDAGYHAPKVMIPGAVPLSGPHAFQPLGSARLWRAPAKVGLTGLAPEELNPIPHPFP
jgi:ribosomal protein S12 methylthiotransferase accessory factor